MSRQDPGLQYPQDIPHTIDKSVHKGFKMVVDNLFSLHKKVADLTAAMPKPTDPKEATTPGGGDTESGQYTPLLDNVLNLTSKAFKCQFLRVGKAVTVSGRVDVDPTAAGTTQLGISLPIQSTIQKAEQCSGAAACPSVAGQSASIQGDTAGNRALMQWVAVDTSNQSMFFTFTYWIV